jgi:hypothetical protein
LSHPRCVPGHRGAALLPPEERGFLRAVGKDEPEDDARCGCRNDHGFLDGSPVIISVDCA